MYVCMCVCVSKFLCVSIQTEHTVRLTRQIHLLNFYSVSCINNFGRENEKE